MGDSPAVKTPSTAKKAGVAASTGKQQSILGFFSKSSVNGSTPASSKSAPKARTVKTEPDSSPCLKESTKSNSMATAKRASISITPVPSSDAAGPLSSQENRDVSTATKVLQDILPLPLTPAELDVKQPVRRHPIMSSSPTRKARDPPLLCSCVIEYENLNH